MIATGKTAKPITALALAMSLALGLVLFPAQEAKGVEIQEETGTITVNETVIGFAGYEWYVVGDTTDGVATDNASHITLLLKTGQNSGEIPSGFDGVAFRESGNTDYTDHENEYGGSNLQNKMEDIADTIPDKEQRLIVPRSLDGINASGPPVNNQRLWPLSEDEYYDVLDYPITNAGQSVLAYDIHFWLRSTDPGINSGGFAALSWGGFDLYHVGIPWAARPALRLNLASVLFASDASGTGGKNTATVGSGFVDTSTPAGPVKLTVLDNALNLDIAPEDISILEASTYAPGTSITIPYENATTSADYISAVITDAGGILYYGKLAQNYDADGTVTVDIPPALADGSYTLKLFTEKCNGNYETDFASQPVAIALDIENASPALKASPGSIEFGNINTNSNTTKTVTVTGTSLAGAIAYSLTGDSVFSVAEDHWNNTAGGELTITFRPTAEKSYTASLTITSPGAQDVVISLSGSGVSSGGGSSSTTGSGGSGSLGSHSIRFEPAGGSPASSLIITEGGRVAKPGDPTKTGYRFTGWYRDAACTTLYNFDSEVTTSFTLYAGWEPLEPGQNTGKTLSPYISGYPDGTFRPDARISRGEAAQLLYNLINNGLIPSNAAESDAHFSDVSSGVWYYDAVTALARTGAASGYPDGTFKPDATVTRAEFTAMVVLLTGLEPEDTASFPDVAKNHWAAGYIAAAGNAGIISGYPEGSFGPEDPVTRAQAVTILNNLLNRETGPALFEQIPMPFTDVPAGHWAYYQIMAAAVAHAAAGDQ